MVYSPWGHRTSNVTEQTQHTGVVGTDMRYEIAFLSFHACVKADRPAHMKKQTCASGGIFTLY